MTSLFKFLQLQYTLLIGLWLHCNAHFETYTRLKQIKLLTSVQLLRVDVDVWGLVACPTWMWKHLDSDGPLCRTCWRKEDGWVRCVCILWMKVIFCVVMFEETNIQVYFNILGLRVPKKLQDRWKPSFEKSAVRTLWKWDKKSRTTYCWVWEGK